MQDNRTVSVANTITHNAAEALIRSSRGRLFAVSFLKRTDGSTRHLLGRLGVRKGLTGEGGCYDAKAHGLVPVYETVRGPRGRYVSGQWRSIPIEGIKWLRIGGETLYVA